MKRSDAVILLQARFASTRLPGKALRRLRGHTVLARCLKRLLASQAAPVVLATTTRRDDEPLVIEASACGVSAVRGATDDVLARFVMAIELLQPRYVIRATADNPAVDIDGVSRVLTRLRNEPVDYVIETGLPCGTAVEGVRAEALLHAAQSTDAAYDREHVTPYVRRRENGYRVLEVPAPESVQRPDLSMTVDTIDDFQWMDQVFAKAGGAAPTLPLVDLIRAADRLRAREAA